MTISLVERIKNIKQEILEMSRSVEKMLEINNVILKGNKFDKQKYGKSVVLENEINRLEVKVYEDLVQAIALYQPAAGDLRKIVGYIEMIRIIERIGDLLITNIKFIRKLYKRDGEIFNQIKGIDEIAIRVYDIYIVYLDAFLTKDETKLYMLFALDEEVNELRNELMKKIKVYMKGDFKSDIVVEISFLVSKYERIADKVKSLAKIMIYILKGEDLRHTNLLEKKGD